MRIVIVGGGIAGLAAAIGLARAGLQPTVLEQALHIDEVGSGLSVWPNALRALDELGVGEQVRRRSQAARLPVIRDVAGRALSVTDIPEMQRRFGPLLMLHRADLLDVLAGALPATVEVRHGVAAHAVHPDGTVEHSAGTAGADVVIGADGINSTVRATVWPGAARPRYLGYCAYRMLTGPVDIRAEGETWGHGQRFGCAGLPDRRVYCFAVLSVPPGQPALDLRELSDRFDGWHAPIPHLLRAVPAGSVLHHDVYELPPLPAYVSGRVGLIGDAAHAMAPDLGQGAGQGIEDAVTLAAMVSTRPTIAAALSGYDTHRRARTRAIARRSRMIGIVAQQRSAPVVALRNALLRAIPDRAVLRALTPVLSWQPPAAGR